jgi:RNA polymerase sigma-70 factor (ECF subfamily)
MNAMGQPDSTPPEPTFATLLCQARAGVRPALAALFERWRPVLEARARHYVVPWLRAKADAADLVQDTFVRALEHLDSFRGSSDAELGGWLFGTLDHVGAQHQRRYAAGGKHQAAGEVSLTDVELDRRVQAALTAPGRSPCAAAAAHEQADMVRRLLGVLSPDDLAIVLWRVRDGLPWLEIARRQNRSVDAVRMRCVRAVKAMEEASASPAAVPRGPCSPADDPLTRYRCLGHEPMGSPTTFTYDRYRPATAGCASGYVAPTADVAPGVSLALEAREALVTMTYGPGTMTYDA